MLANVVVFLFGAVQHAGIAIGPFHEPRIIPAAIVETVCALALLWGSLATFRDRRHAHRAGMIANLIALGGVVIGVIALAVGAGPRTESNDLYHRIMLALIATAFILLAIQSRRRTVVTNVNKP